MRRVVPSNWYLEIERWYFNWYIWFVVSVLLNVGCDKCVPERHAHTLYNVPYIGVLLYRLSYLYLSESEAKSLETVL